jgi:hypothetical protein
MRRLLDTYRRESRKRPAAVRLANIAIGALALGAVLAAVGLGLLAQLVAGLALVPVSLAAALCLLPARLWPDGDDEGGDGGVGYDPDGPSPSGGDGGGTDWDRFEAAFREYVEQRPAARV